MKVINGDRLLQLLMEEEPEVPSTYIDLVEGLMDRCKIED